MLHVPTGCVSQAAPGTYNVDWWDVRKMAPYIMNWPPDLPQFFELIQCSCSCGRYGVLDPRGYAQYVILPNLQFFGSRECCRTAVHEVVRTAWYRQELPAQQYALERLRLANTDVAYDFSMTKGTDYASELTRDAPPTDRGAARRRRLSSKAQHA